MCVGCKARGNSCIHKETGVIVVSSGPLSKKSPPCLSLGRATEVVNLFVSSYMIQLTYTAHVLFARHSSEYQAYTGKKKPTSMLEQ